MKNNLRFLIIFAALNLIFGCAATFAQESKEPITGGYNSADVTDAQIISAAKYAVKAQAKKQRAKIKLTAVKKAERQVVAGLNYGLCLQVEVIEKGKKTAVPQTVQTVVYQNPKQKYELTSWAIAACADETPLLPVK